MDNQAKHTPINASKPDIKGRVMLFSPDSMPYALIESAKDGAINEIVKAVNCHAELLEALILAEETLREMGYANLARKEVIAKATGKDIT